MDTQILRQAASLLMIQQTGASWLKSTAVIALCAVLAACSKPVTVAEPVRAVKIVVVGDSGLSVASEYAGEVRARVESRLGFRVGGKLIKRQAEVGQRVKIGQILAQLDPQDYKLAADSARAAVAAAMTNRDLAAADYKRFQSLKDQNFISGAELERRETTLKAAQAQLEQAQAQQANLGNQVGYANLVADANGIVTAVEAEPGQVVAAGTPVVRIAQDGPRDVVFSVPEDKLGSIAVGMPVQAKRWAGLGSSQASSAAGAGVSAEPLQGHIREIAASADPLTRTFQAKLALEAQDNLPLGTTVNVYPPNPRQGVQAIKLPTSSLSQSSQGSSQVWLLDKASMTVNPVSVQVSTADGNEAVISSGIKLGDLVVAAGAHVLSPGQKVTIYAEKGKIVPIAEEKSAQSATNTVASNITVPVATSAAASTATQTAAAAK